VLVVDLEQLLALGCRERDTAVYGLVCDDSSLKHPLLTNHRGQAAFTFAEYYLGGQRYFPVQTVPRPQNRGSDLGRNRRSRRWSSEFDMRFWHCILSLFHLLSRLNEQRNVLDSDELGIMSVQRA